MGLPRHRGDARFVRGRGLAHAQLKLPVFRQILGREQRRRHHDPRERHGQNTSAHANHVDSPATKKEAGPRPRLTAATYAATWTLICLGLASSRKGRRTVRTPALYCALTLPASTVGGSANVRANEP